jgi:hypothetical protein
MSNKIFKQWKINKETIIILKKVKIKKICKRTSLNKDNRNNFRVLLMNKKKTIKFKIDWAHYYIKRKYKVLKVNILTKYLANNNNNNNHNNSSKHSKKNKVQIVEIVIHLEVRIKKILKIKSWIISWIINNSYSKIKCRAVMNW